MPKLSLLTHAGVKEYALSACNRIGRHPENSIHIVDPRISSRHCEIILDDYEKAYIRDLGSSNGTYLNRRRLLSTEPLEDGDEILIGGMRLVFHAETSVQAARLVSVSTEKEESHIASRVAQLQPASFHKESEILDERMLREDYEKLRVIYELQRDIGFELKIDRILQRILERTHEFLHYDRGVILLMDETGGLQPQAYKTSRPNNKMVISSTLIQRIRTEKVGILSSDAMSDDRFEYAQSIMIQGVRSTIAVPILHQTELLGIMLIDSLVHVNAYTGKDLHLLTNVANQTAQLIKNSHLARKIEQDAVTRERFQRLLSPNLAEMVVSGQLTVEKGGENRSATVLFADIRGFTGMSENMTATDLLRMLNDYYELIVEEVFQQEGTVDKFIGDGIMVIWGAPVKHADDPIRAVRAACRMQQRMIEFNRQRRSEGHAPIQIGIGVNSGSLVAGYIGSSQTMSYSVVGDAVNTASRLCSAAAAGQILISGETFREVKDYFRIREMPLIQLKGKTKPVQVYEVFGDSPF
ncbi:MAG: adenylate/guanylate cyclase domain-containing protein [Thermodesulfobacteriota bacterium]